MDTQAEQLFVQDVPERPEHPAPEGGQVIERGSEAWPPSLDDLAHPPERLFCLGDSTALQGPCVSIVGARRPTPYGEAIAEFAGRIAAECGVTVVSGGAMGCDVVAERAALAAGGRTVLVAGAGADVTYPRRSSDVFDAARAGRGCVASLMPWGYEPLPFVFPQRNPVIAALSAATIVCEAGLPSGTLSTAEAAAEMGRTLLAIPGSIFSPQSRGCNRLICDGAQPVTDESELEGALCGLYGTLRRETLGGTPDRGRLLSALVASPLRVDELSARLDLSLARVMRAITAYEVRGLVCRLPDGRISPTRQALLMRGDVPREQGL